MVLQGSIVDRTIDDASLDRPMVHGGDTHLSPNLFERLHGIVNSTYAKLSVAKMAAISSLLFSPSSRLAKLQV